MCFVSFFYFYDLEFAFESFLVATRKSSLSNFLFTFFENNTHSENYKSKICQPFPLKIDFFFHVLYVNFNDDDDLDPDEKELLNQFL